MKNPNIRGKDIEDVFPQSGSQISVHEESAEIGSVSSFAHSSLAKALGVVGLSGLLGACVPEENQQIDKMSPRNLEAVFNQGKARTTLAEVATAEEENHEAVGGKILLSAAKSARAVDDLLDLNFAAVPGQEMKLLKANPDEPLYMVKGLRSDNRDCTIYKVTLEEGAWYGEKITQKKLEKELPEADLNVLNHRC